MIMPYYLSDTDNSKPDNPLWKPAILTKQGIASYWGGRVHIDRRDGNGFIPCLSEQEKQELITKTNKSDLLTYLLNVKIQY